MRRIVAHFILGVALLLPNALLAEPIKLKLAFFSSDRTHLYRAAVKPFVDAVNAEGRGKVEIEVYLSGALGQYPIKQSQLLRDGKADIAYIVQPYEREEFPDSAVIELPGIYKDGRDATLAFSYLASTGLMRGYDDFFTIGTFASEPESIHTRSPAASLADLKGRKIRANNNTESVIFTQLGIKPVFVPLTETALAISSGKIDGAAAPPVPMIEFGIGRVASNHYMLATTSVPLSLLMTKERLASLPEDVRAIIKKFSGPWAVDNYIRINEASTAAIMNQLESDPRRTVTTPTQDDKKTVEAVYKSIVYDFAAASPHNAK